MRISEILATKGSKVITIGRESSIQEAVNKMEAHNIGGLVVVDLVGQVKGIVTERDIIREAASSNPNFKQPVKGIMTRRVITGKLNDELDSVAHTMTELRFRHLPVLDGDRLIGIVTIGDVVRAQRDSYLGQVVTLESMIEQEEIE